MAQSFPVQAEQEFTDLVAKVMPSVVNISIEAMGQRVKLEVRRRFSLRQLRGRVRWGWLIVDPERAHHYEQARC